LILDPGNRYIKAITAHASLKDAAVLEIGCGTGRITGDLAQQAKRIVATDMDNKLIRQAEKKLTHGHVEFLHTPEGLPQLAPGIFDLVIYTLSLHHIPKEKMREHLLHCGTLLKDNGKIIVVEPGNSGTFLDIKKRFGAGSGDEGPEKEAAIRAIQNLPGWKLSVTYPFDVDFLFTDNADFFSNKLPNYARLSAEALMELESALDRYRTTDGIILSSERYLNVLQRTTGKK